MSANESVTNNARVNALVENLRSKLKNFKVIDREGQLIGEVKDLILENNRQINLVISQMTTGRSSHLFLLMSKLVHKIDPPNKSVLVKINKVEIARIPEYVIPETPDMELSEMNNSPLTPADEALAEAGTMRDSDNFADPASISDSIPSSEVPEELSPLTSTTPEVLEDEIIRLLGERLIVERSKRKVGEVIVRKEIETLMVQVPVRREKLIVEQVSPERKQLAEIDLGQEEVKGTELNEDQIPEINPPEAISSNREITTLEDNELTVRGEFSSPKIASLLLNAIALERRHGCKRVIVEIVVEDVERQNTYQQWFERSSGGSKKPPTT